MTNDTVMPLSMVRNFDDRGRPLSRHQSMGSRPVDARRARSQHMQYDDDDVLVVVVVITINRHFETHN